MITARQVEDARRGDQRAAEAIVEAVRPTVQAIAGAYCSGDHLEDATAEGLAAVWAAVVTYHPGYPVDFETVARQAAARAILDYLATTGSGPTVSPRTARRYYALLRAAGGDLHAAAKLAASPGSDITPATLWAVHAALTGTEPMRDEPARPVAEDDQPGYGAAVAKLFAVLTDEERCVVSMAHGLGDLAPMSDRRIAEVLGTSRRHVQRVRSTALDKLRQRAADLSIGAPWRAGKESRHGA
jgi:RNA polymerase sigma factor (sigma-70 family)